VIDCLVGVRAPANRSLCSGRRPDRLNAAAKRIGQAQMQRAVAKLTGLVAAVSSAEPRMKKDEARAAPHASCHAAWSACSLALRSNCSRNNLREPKQRDGTVAARSRSIPALQLNKRFKRRFFWWATKLERALAMASSASLSACRPWRGSTCAPRARIDLRGKLLVDRVELARRDPLLDKETPLGLG